MIAAWMLYTVAVTLLLLAGATAGEYVARAVRAPTRVVCATAIIVALGLSARALIVGLDSRRETQASANNAGIREGVGTLDSIDSATARLARDATAPNLISRLVGAARATATAFVRIEQSGARIDVRRFDRWNGVLGGLWVGGSAIALSLLVASFTRLRRIERSLAAATVRDHPVLVARHLGPAVIGVLRSRVVLPEWVLTLPARERDVILAHEREHAAAFDQLLITAAMFVVALQPWNIALWGLIARLRVAVEGDCDRRVLDAIGDDDGRWYGRLLISVYENTTLGPSLSIGFVARPSNLERRLRRIMVRPRVISMAGVTSLFAAAILVMTACRAAAPVRREMPSPVADKSMASLSSERLAPSNTVPALTPLASTARDAAPPPDRRCSLSERDTESRSGKRSVLWPGQWPVKAGCSIYGDIVVVYIDSTNVLVSARDTADVGITVFFVFETEPGTTAPDLVWSTTAGRAALSDTTMSFTSPIGRTRPLVLRLRAAQTDVRPADVLELKIDNMMMAEMRGISWETIAQLPGAPRCTAAERDNDTIPRVGLGRSSPGTAGKMRRACFVTRGSRFEFPVF